MSELRGVIEESWEAKAEIWPVTERIIRESERGPIEASVVMAVNDVIDNGADLRLDGRQRRAAHAIGLPDAITKARRQAPDAKRLRRRMFEWLDAFRTVKLVHALRDDDLPSMSIEMALTAWGYPGDPRDLEAGLAWTIARELPPR